MRHTFVRNKSNLSLRVLGRRAAVPRAVFDAGDDADAFPLLERRLQPLSVREGELEREIKRMTKFKG